MIIFLIILGSIVALFILLILVYANRNLHRDEKMMKKVKKAGYVEKQVTLPNGTVLNYGEGGSDHSDNLLLIHGQGQAWQDYNAVLPELAKKYHVFSIDCHGHGKSSHNPERYHCKDMTEDFIWFAKNVIKTSYYVSGHSSGGILASNMAALDSESVKGLLIEDSPFFCVQPDEMVKQNAIVWKDSFELMHNFAQQKEVSSFAEYFMKNSVIMSLFGTLKDKVAVSAKEFIEKHPNEPLRIWYVPQSILRGLFYGHMFDLKFAETFYDGTWFDGVSQEEILRGIQCPCTYIKAKTGYFLDGKLTMEIGDQDITEAILCCANTDEDAEKVRTLVKNCRSVVTESNDHLIHAKYPELFIAELVRFLS